MLELRQSRTAISLTLRAIDEEETDISEEVRYNDEELQARCLVQKSEDKLWQEAICTRDKQQLKKAAHSTALSVARHII